jgi:hypothetical protein
MKDLKEYILESLLIQKESPFKNTTKFELSQWEEWKSNTKTSNQIIAYEDTENGIYNVYMNHKHVAQYKVDDQLLCYDDPKLFNLEENEDDK